ncbi:hypothetical protein DBR32_15415 [Taibaiella sp. KBW10]|uniref:TPM domain-containing protein n=1 Tax=Taibaiella sp. KBW10 TaxID=2153357 RepID=UPI000F5A906E|nr:TPM domain-containing protein [Taibaiella sp. KBW10]RQO29645.1 hypothetical protein DBR32_15415 [Taibaiella sp. KBW10]
MSHSKFISLLLLFICYVTSCRSQTKPSPLRIETSSDADLHTYRQKFWDSLPAPTNYTNDYEDLFSPKEQEKLDSIIAAFRTETTTQICIVTLDTLYTSQEQFNALALHIANTWGIGLKGKDNGILICISKGYRMMRICNGYGIAAILSDEETKAITDKYFLPQFKNGAYFTGTYNGLMTLMDTLRMKLNSK